MDTGVEVAAEVDTGAAAGASLVGGVAEDIASTTASVVEASAAIMEFLTTTTLTSTVAFGDMGVGFAQVTAGMGIEERATILKKQLLA